MSGSSASTPDVTTTSESGPAGLGNIRWAYWPSGFIRFMRGIGSATGRTVSSLSAMKSSNDMYYVEAACASPDRCKAVAKGQPAMYSAVVEDHQLVLVGLYAHAQHGNCGLDVTLNGEALL